jgi:hypothetical protein
MKVVAFWHPKPFYLQKQESNFLEKSFDNSIKGVFLNSDKEKSSHNSIKGGFLNSHNIFLKLYPKLQKNMIV